MRGDGTGDFEVTEWRVDPQELGLAPATMADLRGGNAAFNAGVIRSVLEGEQGARRDIGILNAAAALVVAGRVDDLQGGLALATDVHRQRPGRRCARRADRYVARRAAPATGLTRQLRRGAWVSGRARASRARTAR